MAKTESTGDSSSSLLNSNTFTKNHNHSHTHNNQNHHNHNHTYIRHHRPSCDKSAAVNTHFNGVGTVTRASGNKLRNHHQHSNSSSNSVQHHHQTPSSNHNQHRHVAIATQVISPSAIGGSLKIGNRRFCKHYDHEQDDDDEDDHGIFTRRRRVPWGKLTCYGISIGIILLILTGVVLGVGFMQAEKQKILTVKSQKLFLPQELQKRKYNINVTLDSAEGDDDDDNNDDDEVDYSEENDSNNPFMRKPFINDKKINMTNMLNDTISSASSSSSSSEVVTTSPTPTEQSIQSPISKKNDENVEDSEKETQIPKQFSMENNIDGINKNKHHNEEDSDEEEDNENDDDDDSSEEELEIYEPSLSQSLHNDKNGESRKGEQTAQINARNDDVLLLFGNTNTNINTNTNGNTNNNPNHVQQFNLNHGEGVNEALPSEVKVLPPHGFSFGFPILNFHNTTTTTVQEKETVNSVNDNNSYNNNNITFPSFSFTNPINPTSSSSLLSVSSSSSSPVNDFPLIDLNFTFNPHASVLNYTEQQQQQHVGSKHNQFDFNPSKNLLDDDMLKKGEFFKQQQENSFNTQSPFNKDKSIQFQTEIFNADEEVGDKDKTTTTTGSSNSGIDKTSRSDSDSEMSASNKMRGRNPPKMTPADNTYTPRPGSSPNRPGRPLFSTKTKSHHNNNNNHNNYDYSPNLKSTDGMSLVQFYSDRSEVKVPAPSSMTTRKPDNLQFNFAQFTSTSSPNHNGQTNENKGDSSNGKTDVNLNLYNFSNNNVKSNSIQDGGNPSSSSSSSSYSTSSSSSSNSPSSNLDLTNYQIVTPSTISNSPLNTNTYTNTNTNPSSTSSDFHFDFSTLTTPAPHTGATTPLNFDVNVNLQSSSSTTPDVLSKRTYNFEYDTGSSGLSTTFNPSGSNPFAHLLGPQAAVTGVIGQASSTGANLGYNFQDFNSGFNYGGQQSSAPSLSHLPSGTIPLDLASSYIQVGYPGFTKNQNQGQSNGNGDSNYGGGSGSSNSYDYTTAYSNTNPTLALSTLLQNGAGGGGSSGQYGGGFSSGLNNKQPDYNTITQGIHLLSLLSGNIPHHLVDTQTSASNIHEQQSQSIARPEFQIAALTGLGGSSGQFVHGLHSSISSDSNSHNSNSNGGSSNFYLSPYLPAESRSLHTSSSDLHSSKSFPPPDQQTSFSQNIVTKLADFSNIYKKSVGSTDPNGKAGDSLTSETVVIPSSISISEPLIREVEKSNNKNHNNNMFQFKIDENSNLKSILESGGGINREIDKISDIPSALSTAPDLKDISKSSSSTSLASSSPPSSSASSSSPSLTDMETSASEARHILSVPSKIHLQHITNLISSEKPRINFSKKLLIKTNKRTNENSPAAEMRQEKGLKSGFYI